MCLAQGSEQFKQLQQQLSTVLTRALHKMRSKITNFEKQMGSTEESQAIQKQADMLTANIYKWEIVGSIMRNLDCYMSLLQLANSWLCTWPCLVGDCCDTSYEMLCLLPWCCAHCAVIAMVIVLGDNLTGIDNL